MADMASVSRTDLTTRRKKLRRQRRVKIIQTIWRTIAVTALAGGSFWVAIQPTWVLKAPQEIEVSGNDLISNEKIQSLLPLSYPQSLWKIEPSKIARSLQRQPAIAHANVSRRLFPPGLIVELKERVPVAVAQNRGKSDNAISKTTIGLLDATGVLMPIETYKSNNAKLPNLKVIGSPEQYHQLWGQLYQALSGSSLKVLEIDWQDPNNLILKTELGKVHLGAIGPQLPEQIKVLAQMRHLPTQVNTNQIEYIDLRNPESPLIQIYQSTNEPKKRLSNP